MEEADIRKYILEQARIEIEHTRSWPTKVMAFYVAINIGLVATLITLKDKGSLFPLYLPIKATTTIFVSILACWVLQVLCKNHKNYLRYRNLQIDYQRKFLADRKEELGLPCDWFDFNKVSAFRRFGGWGLYAYIVVLITVFVLAVIWV